MDDPAGKIMSKVFYLLCLWSPHPPGSAFPPQWDLVHIQEVGRSGSWVLCCGKGNMSERRETKGRRVGLLMIALIPHFLDFASMFTLHSM